MHRIMVVFLTTAVVGFATLAATWEPLPELRVESPAVVRSSGSCVGFGSTVEFRETVHNPLGGDDIYLPNADGVARDEEGFIRE